MRPSLSTFAVIAALALAAAPATAGGVWDFFGGAGINAGRTDNPGFAGTEQRNPNYDPNDPNAPDCMDPNTPTNDPDYVKFCLKSIQIPGAERRSDFTGSARLTGGVRGSWASTNFDASYSPSASFFYENSHLNQVSHALASNWRHAWSTRSALSLNTTLNYSPEQDIDPNNLQNGNLLTTRTSRFYGTFRSAFAHQATARSSFDWSYRYSLRAFSADEFVDSTDHNIGVNWRRRLGPRAFVQSGYEYGVTFFGDGTSDPNLVAPRSFDSSHQRVSGGWGIETTHGFTVSLNAGYNVVAPFDDSVANPTYDPNDAACDPNSAAYDPDDPVCRRRLSLDSFSGLYVNATAGWSGRIISTSGGYLRSISEGGGAFANAQTESLHASLRAAFTKTLSGDLALTHGVHERLAHGTGGGSDETVRTTNAKSALAWKFARDWSVNADWAHYRQSAGGSGSHAPDLRSNRYSAGIAWSVR